jgi:hypothetical protein
MPWCLDLFVRDFLETRRRDTTCTWILRFSKAGSIGEVLYLGKERLTKPTPTDKSSPWNARDKNKL